MTDLALQGEFSVFSGIVGLVISHITAVSDRLPQLSTLHGMRFKRPVVKGLTRKLGFYKISLT